MSNTTDNPTHEREFTPLTLIQIQVEQNVSEFRYTDREEGIRKAREFAARWSEKLSSPATIRVYDLAIVEEVAK